MPVFFRSAGSDERGPPIFNAAVFHNFLSKSLVIQGVQGEYGSVDLSASNLFASPRAERSQPMSSLSSRSFSVQHFAAAILACSLMSSYSSNSACGQGIAGASGSRAALFQFQPQTSEQLLNAAVIAWKLDRISDARNYLRQLGERDPQSAELVLLRKQQGQSVFIELYRDRRLHPESVQMLRNLRKSLPQSDNLQLPQRVADLSAGGTRGADAVTELLLGGDAAVSALLAADPATQAGASAQAFLEEHSADLRDELLRQLPAADSAGQIRVLKLLAGTVSPDTAWSLVKLQFHSDVNVAAAAKQAVRRLSRGAITVGNSADAAALLISEAEKNLQAAADRSPVGSPVLLETDDTVTARLKKAEWLLADALSLQRGHSRGVILERLVAAAGADPTVTAQAGPLAGKPAAELTAVLGVALELQQWPAAIECLRGLSATDLAAADKQAIRALLNEAILSTDVRVRVLAAAAARKNSISAGNALFTISDVLAAAEQAVSQPEAVVIAPDDQLSLVLRQLLEDQKYSVQVAETGPQGFVQAVGCLHSDVIFLSLYPSRWPASTTLANLRADCRTRSCPVVLIGRQDQQTEAAALQQIYGNVYFMSEPIGVSSFPSQFRGLNLRPLLSGEEREFLSALAAPSQSATAPQQ